MAARLRASLFLLPPIPSAPLHPLRPALALTLHLHPHQHHQKALQCGGPWKRDRGKYQNIVKKAAHYMHPGSDLALGPQQQQKPGDGSGYRAVSS